jgi:FkbM family methyltransferase
MQRLKVLIGKIITTPLLGNLIGFLKSHVIQWRGVKIGVKSNLIKGRVKATLFWGIYESAEARLIKKHIPSNPYPIIELGASIGAVSSLLNKHKLPSVRSIHIEADERLIPLLLDNISTNNGQNWDVLFAIIADEGYVFQVGAENTVGKVVKAEGVPSEHYLSLSSFLQKHSIHEYFLVSDIEGAEAFFLFKDNAALANCKGLIIELHKMELENKIYKVEDMVDALEAKGFKIEERRGPNVYATKD